MIARIIVAVLRKLELDSTRARSLTYAQWVTAIATILLAFFALFAWLESRKSTHDLEASLDLSTRAILVTDPATWKIPTVLAPGEKPVVAFKIKNAGKSNAHILQATYDFAISDVPPGKIVKSRPITDWPALVGPDIVLPVIVSDLPILSAEDFQRISDGESVLWLRTLLVYRDDLGEVYLLIATGRYGKSVTETGKTELHFTSPDAAIPGALWDDQIFGGRRCLNIIVSEPVNLGCGENN